MDLMLLYQEPFLIIATMAILAVITLLLCIQYARSAFAKRKSPDKLRGELPGVSIVLCVRNEYDNLVRLLPALLEQEYDHFEVIVVNKNSEDDTEILLTSLEHYHHNLTIRNLAADRKFGHDNLMALGIGVRAARYPYVVFFRPDCHPSSEKWLASLIRNIPETSATAVIGYISFKGSPPLVRYDMLEQQLHYMAMADLNLAYTSEGNNTLFLKEKLISGKEFDTMTTTYNQCEQAIVSHVTSEGKTRSCIYPEGTVTLNRRVSLKEYHLTRIRNLKTMVLTKSRSYLLLTFEKVCIAAFYVMLILTILRSAGTWNIYELSTIGGMLLLRWITLWIHHAGYRIHLREKELVYAAPLWDPVSVLVHFYFLAALFVKRIKN